MSGRRGDCGLVVSVRASAKARDANASGTRDVIDGGCRYVPGWDTARLDGRCGTSREMAPRPDWKRATGASQKPLARCAPAIPPATRPSATKRTPGKTGFLCARRESTGTPCFVRQCLVENFRKSVENLLRRIGTEGGANPLFQSGSGVVPRDAPYPEARHGASPPAIRRETYRQVIDNPSAETGHALSAGGGESQVAPTAPVRRPPSSGRCAP